ncbi:DeoR/GlpR family DNA-binding transcription regulator [Paucibacter sp. Y2R2-4]|uniref:DeoR/GlpR family DNA-binding transcription regulator n=1 Tax=Paucibacter sp. Y2R2-4 TaxID=2893553 RepID=UPI0021E497FE|nr:DeoR/GlpR family DNA-binding transcription regulator [Paucibacter sp. Y2R2-4]MCV2350291.1 DeoR/GlpR family DNA-binding transcription regulator [Paucibacter sp. Y2R2-4]
MWTPERHDKIISLLNERQRLTTDAFALELGVSKETVRRDLIELEAHGKLSRVHGGAVPCIQSSETQAEASYQERVRLHQPEKQAIARAAASLIRAGSCCFIDAGSTTHALAQSLLQNGRDLRVITNSVEVARTLSGSSEIQTHLLGGQLQTDVPATSGEFTVSEITRFHADFALISPTALNPEHGALDYAWHEAHVARAMLSRARSCIMLADANKLGNGSRLQICPPTAIDVLVTDERADASMLERLRNAGVKQTICAPS